MTHSRLSFRLGLGPRLCCAPVVFLGAFWECTKTSPVDALSWDRNLRRVRVFCCPKCDWGIWLSGPICSVTDQRTVYAFKYSECLPRRRKTRES